MADDELTKPAHLHIPPNALLLRVLEALYFARRGGVLNVPDLDDLIQYLKEHG